MKRAGVCRSIALLVAVAVGWPLSGSARAQTDPRPREAKQKCAEGNYQEGTRILAELYAATDDLVWVYNQGRCYQQNGRREEALNRFREYLRRATNATPTDRAEVEGFIRELEQPPPAPPPALPVEAPAPPPPPPVAEPPAAAALVATAPPARRSPRPFYYASAGLAAAGAAALASGVVFSFKERSLDEELDRATRAGVGSLDYERWRSQERDGRRYRTYQIVGYTAAGVLLAGSGVALYLGRRRAEPGALALRPVLLADQAGGSLQVEF